MQPVVSSDERCGLPPLCVLLGSPPPPLRCAYRLAAPHAHASGCLLQASCLGWHGTRDAQR